MAVSTKYAAVHEMVSAESQMLKTEDGEARVFGHITNTTVASQFLDYLVTIEVPISANVVTGDTVNIYVIESQDDVTFTDHMLYPDEGDQADKLRDSKLISVVDAFHLCAAPFTVVTTFHLGAVFPILPPFMSFVFENNTSGSIKPGASANHMGITISAS